ncbi:MAG: DeoR family transcriptional regulator [bacterium]|nr:DeoR family transcriptional regulator [bacterium]
MDARQAKLLNLVIENYIATAEPIGSKFLVSASKLDWSEATVRNDLRALEEAGYLSHPHTSAGRVPTEKGYRYFVDSLDLEKIKTGKKDDMVLEDMMPDNLDFEIEIKNLAKLVVDLTGTAVLLALAPNKVYYTGLSNLFNQPEFEETQVVLEVSSMFDRCEECVEDFYDKTTDEIEFFIGSEHPFGMVLSTTSMRFGDSGLFLLLGPLRTDYKKNFGIMKKIKEII